MLLMQLQPLTFHFALPAFGPIVSGGARVNRLWRILGRRVISVAMKKSLYAGVRLCSGTPALMSFLLLQVTPLSCSTSNPNKLFGLDSSLDYDGIVLWLVAEGGDICLHLPWERVCWSTLSFSTTLSVRLCSILHHHKPRIITATCISTLISVTGLPTSHLLMFRLISIPELPLLMIK